MLYCHVQLLLYALLYEVDLLIFYLFLILIWLPNVFEADFQTHPKKKKILFG